VRPTGTLFSFVVNGMRSCNELRVSGIVIEWSDETATIRAFVHHRTARVAVHLDAREATHDRRHVDVDSVRRSHSRQVVVLVLVESFLFSPQRKTTATKTENAPLNTFRSQQKHGNVTGVGARVIKNPKIFQVYLNFHLSFS